MPHEFHPVSSELSFQWGAGGDGIVRLSLSCVSETLEKGKHKASEKLKINITGQ